MAQEPTTYHVNGVKVTKAEKEASEKAFFDRNPGMKMGSGGARSAGKSPLAKGNSGGPSPAGAAVHPSVTPISTLAEKAYKSGRGIWRGVRAGGATRGRAPLTAQGGPRRWEGLTPRESYLSFQAERYRRMAAGLGKAAPKATNPIATVKRGGTTKTPEGLQASHSISSEINSMFPTAGLFASPLGSGSGTGFDKPLMTRDTFFNFLATWETALPLQALWAVIFKIPEKVTTETMNKWGEYIGAPHNVPLPGGPHPAVGSVNSVRAKLLEGGYPKNGAQNALGCLFAQTIGIPVEQSAIATVGPSNRGFIKGPIMEQRQTFAPLNIEFLETNVSFNEFILRPWAIICQHEGLVARNWNAEFRGQHDEKERVTTDITIINFGKTGHHGMGMIPRKIWMFTDCFPVNIGPERYSYSPGGDSEPDRRDTEWNFRRYQVIIPQQYIHAMDGIEQRRKDTKGHK